jgi:sigma-B regulation protein RsbU (phosphoserine phosphatase)
MSASTSALLIVDDNEDNRYTLTRRLQREGYGNLTTANDGQQALDLLQTRPFDLLLLDVMMQGLNGYEVLERMRADNRLRHIPVIMISALDEIDSVIRCVELGAEDYLAKPFNPTLLRARVGASLEKKRLRDELVRHTHRMERELETAREIQLSMVPNEFPAPTPERPLEIFATLQPAREVGGDLYDFFWVSPERLCLVVADVSDKGAGAALFMARAKSVIHLLASLLPGQGGRPATAAELMARVNQELCRDNPHGLFVTLVLATLDARTGELEYCSAGHHPPCVISPQAEVMQLDGARGKPVGIRESFRYEAATLKLAPGDSFFIFTDGITEAMNEQGELFGEERLLASLRSCTKHPPRDLVAAVLRDVREFAGAAAPSDDIAALACRWRA